VTGGPDLAGLLADPADTVVLTQASTPTEARLIRERIAAADGTGQSLVRLGAPDEASARVPQSVLDRGDDVRLVPVRPSNASSAPAAR